MFCRPWGPAPCTGAIVVAVEWHRPGHEIPTSSVWTPVIVAVSGRVSCLHGLARRLSFTRRAGIQLTGNLLLGIMITNITRANIFWMSWNDQIGEDDRSLAHLKGNAWAMLPKTVDFFLLTTLRLIAQEFCNPFSIWRWPHSTSSSHLAYILMRGNLDLKRPRCLLKFKWLGPVAAFESRAREWYVLIARTSPSPGQRYTVTESIETSWWYLQLPWARLFHFS